MSDKEDTRQAELEAMESKLTELLIEIAEYESGSQEDNP